MIDVRDDVRWASRWRRPQLHNCEIADPREYIGAQDAGGYTIHAQRRRLSLSLTPPASYALGVILLHVLVGKALGIVMLRRDPIVGTYVGPAVVAALVQLGLLHAL